MRPADPRRDFRPHAARADDDVAERFTARRLRPGGHLLATLATSDEPAYTEDFFGVDMYWSNFGIARYHDMLASLGFELLADGVVSHGYTDEDARPEVHPLVLARRP